MVYALVDQGLPFIGFGGDTATTLLNTGTIPQIQISLSTTKLSRIPNLRLEWTGKTRFPLELSGRPFTCLLLVRHQIAMQRCNPLKAARILNLG